MDRRPLPLPTGGTAPSPAIGGDHDGGQADLYTRPGRHVELVVQRLISWAPDRITFPIEHGRQYVNINIHGAIIGS